MTLPITSGVSIRLYVFVVLCYIFFQISCDQVNISSYCTIKFPQLKECTWCVIDTAPKINDSAFMMKSITKTVKSQSEIKSFIILSYPRSGSTFLTVLLKSHREILMYGEIFNPYDNPSKQQKYYDQVEDFIPRHIFNARSNFTSYFLEYLLSNSKNRTTIGFKLLRDQLCMHDQVQVLIKDKPNMKKVILYRADILSVYTSYLIAAKLDTWTTVNTSGYQIEVDMADFKLYVDAYISYYRTVAREITQASQEYFLIEYNRDILNKTNLGGTIARLQKFLNVTVIEPVILRKKNSNFKKQSNAKHISTHIINWQNLSAEVRAYANTTMDFNDMILQSPDEYI